jgi:hypothetical protein
MVRKIHSQDLALSSKEIKCSTICVVVCFIIHAIREKVWGVDINPGSRSQITAYQIIE